MKNAGFTLVELLVTISIFVILTGVVLFSQTRFNSTIFLTNLAYDMALTIRQAQTFGINIKEFNGDKFLPYGVHFDKTSANNRSFILFADLDYDNALVPGGGKFLGTASQCDAAQGCVSRYNITKGNYIADICTEDPGVGVTTCPTGKSSETLDIVFIRPNPDAKIRFKGSPELKESATIILGGATDSKKKVRVLSTGLIEVAR
jgi:prepilin-type N-terminal cleavage/methylation domain-containing protein